MGTVMQMPRVFTRMGFRSGSLNSRSNERWLTRRKKNGGSGVAVVATTNQTSVGLVSGGTSSVSHPCPRQLLQLMILLLFYLSYPFKSLLTANVTRKSFGAFRPMRFLLDYRFTCY
ncbi:unnamed protein product [Prunus armeniaca]